MACRRRALLIFADVRALDLKRRRLDSSFGQLFRGPSSATTWAADTDCHLFTTAAAAPRLLARNTSSSLAIHAQKGATFAEKLEGAVEAIAARGYEEVVIIGSDCPELTASDVGAAFEELARHTLVLGPDHRGGCYLIALRLEARARLRGVHWQRDTDCRQLVERFGASQTFLLPSKLDLDSLADVRLLARQGRDLWWARLARNLLQALDTVAARCVAWTPFSFAFHRLRARWQLPPPFAAILRPI